MPDSDNTTSKSALKREMTALQELGRQLIEMPDGQRAKLPLSDDLREAIALYQRLGQREARRRQLQFIGKQMRREDREAIAAALAGFEQQARHFRQQFQRLETLRDQLILGGDQHLETLLEERPDLDRQRLRQLVRQARQESARGKPPTSSRKLFRYLRDTFEEAGEHPGQLDSDGAWESPADDS